MLDEWRHKVVFHYLRVKEVFFLFCRLPIVQGATFSFLGPTIAILNLPDYKCPAAVNGTVPGESLQFKQFPLHTMNIFELPFVLW